GMAGKQYGHSGENSGRRVRSRRQAFQAAPARPPFAAGYDWAPQGSVEAAAATGGLPRFQALAGRGSANRAGCPLDRAQVGRTSGWTLTTILVRECEPVKQGLPATPAGMERGFQT